jgi:uncharacterized protein YciI
MFLVLLPLSANRARAPELLAAHKAWIQRGLDEGVFLLVGGLQPQGGGMILAQGLSREALELRVKADPFVEHDVVGFELIEFAPTFAEARLSFLLA